jgi:phosphoribosyl 1,2-cyclic phosphodiesterase
MDAQAREPLSAACASQVAAAPPHGEGAMLCVLASGSSGNCSILLTRRAGLTRLTLIDLGLSPRRTFGLLEAMGLRPDQIDDALLTHLDCDHFCPTWARYLPRHARLRVHARHAAALPMLIKERLGTRLRPFTGGFDLDDGLHVWPMLMAHDDAGVCAFRFDLPGFGPRHGASDALGGSLGFCTDLGRVTLDLVEHLRRCPRTRLVRPVDVLALESNYCPRMQLDSDRPDALKRRIMGGRGHLSNQQAAEALAAVQPGSHAVLLHLSRQCNRPDLAAAAHGGAAYALTVSGQFAPTPWIPIQRPAVARTTGSAAPVISTDLAQTANLFTLATATMPF